MSEASILTARVGQVQIGFPMGQVREVYPLPPVTPVPAGPEHVVGVINLRGTVAPAFDTAGRLGVAAEGGRMVVSVEHQGEPCALVVDEVGQVVGPCATDPVPPTLAREMARAATGVAKVDGGLVVILDAEALLAA